MHTIEQYLTTRHHNNGFIAQWYNTSNLASFPESFTYQMTNAQAADTTPFFHLLNGLSTKGVCILNMHQTRCIFTCTSTLYLYQRQQSLDCMYNNFCCIMVKICLTTVAHWEVPENIARFGTDNVCANCWPILTTMGKMYIESADSRQAGKRIKHCISWFARKYRA